MRPLSLKASWTRRPSQRPGYMPLKSRSSDQCREFSANFSPLCCSGCLATDFSGAGPWIPLMLSDRLLLPAYMSRFQQVVLRMLLTVRSSPLSCSPSISPSSPPSPPSPSPSTAPLWWRRITGSTSRLQASSQWTKSKSSWWAKRSRRQFSLV